MHRRDVAALVELATIARECGAHADRVGENQPSGEIGRLTEFCVGGPGEAAPRSAIHLRTILRGVRYADFDAQTRRMAFSVGGVEYVLSSEASYVLLARFWGPTGGRPVFYIGGLSAGGNLAGARYLSAHHAALSRRYGSDQPFALVLRIVEPAAYGTDFTELVADVSDVAFQPVPRLPGPEAAGERLPEKETSGLRLSAEIQAPGRASVAEGAVGGAPAVREPVAEPERPEAGVRAEFSEQQGSTPAAGDGRRERN